MKRLGCAVITLILALTALIPPVRAEEPEYPAKAYVLMDAATGTVLKAYNEHEALPPASVTKVMTLLLIMEAVDSGQIKWTDTVTASEAAAAKGGSQVYLKVGENMAVEEMVKSIAVSSANDCACAMAEHLAGSETAFVEKMNARAAALGMKDTHFVNCTGLDDGADASAHRTSAYDIALMSRELLTKHPDIKKFTTIWMDSVRDGAFGRSNTNKLVRFYPGCTGLKTGYTSGAGHCLSASALRDGMELIAVVLGCGSSTDRFAACKSMLDYGFANYALFSVPSQESSVPVKMGVSNQISVVPQYTGSLLVEKGRLADINIRTALPDQITAPVEKGQVIGEITVLRGDEVLTRIPLTAAENMERLSWLDLFLQLLGRIAMAGQNALSESPKPDG